MPHPAVRDDHLPRRPFADSARRAALLRVSMSAGHYTDCRELALPSENARSPRLHAPSGDEGATDRPLDRTRPRHRAGPDRLWRGRVVRDALLHLWQGANAVLAGSRALCARRRSCRARQGTYLVQLGVPRRDALQSSFKEVCLRTQGRQGLRQLPGMFRAEEERRRTCAFRRWRCHAPRCAEGRGRVRGGQGGGKDDGRRIRGRFAAWRARTSRPCPSARRG